MRLVLAIAVILAAAVGLGLALLRGSDEPIADSQVPAASGQDPSRSLDASLSPAQRLEHKLHLRPETTRGRGEFALRGKKLSLDTAETTDGYWCLIDVQKPSLSTGSTCYDGVPFARSKVLYSINMEGGPEKFGEMYVLGVASPEVRAVVLDRTDGTTVETLPNGAGGFVFESTPADLEAHVYPTALRLYGPSGKLIETVDFPAAG